MKVIIKKILLFFIKIYQLCISPLIGDNCRFSPSCSNYAKEALEKYGPFRGLWLAIKRICRCHPWSEGGHDPLL